MSDDELASGVGDGRDSNQSRTEMDPQPDGGYTISSIGRAAANTDPTIAMGMNTDAANERSSGTWYHQLAILAETEYRLAIRGRWAIAMTAIFAAFALGLTTFSGVSVSPEGFERTVASLGVLAVYLVPLVALAFSYDAVVGREVSGWLHTLFALPVDRGLIVLGTSVGRGIVFASATIIGFGVAGFFLLLEFGVVGFDTYVGFMLVTVGVGLAFLAIGVLVSTLVSEKTHALGLSLLVWAWFVLVHDLIALGVIAAFDLSEIAVSAMLLANPTGIFRALVLGSLGAAGDAGFASVLAESGLSIGVLAGGLLAWIVLPIAFAIVVVRRRRL